MKKEVISLFFIIGLILSFGFISANFELGEIPSLIEKSYGPSDYIKGWINISLEDESTASIFKDNADNSISLINLLKTNENFTYICNPLNCQTDYLADNSQTEKTFSLDKDNSMIFGFKINGKLLSVNSINFTIESDVGSSCYSQLKIDFFNDEIIDFTNNKAKDTPSCDWLKSYGCFDSNKDTATGVINTIPYCQKIKLSESPSFKLGAWVKKEIEGNKKLIMELYNNFGMSIKNCELPKEEISEIGEEISCDINYSATESEDYYVCIYSNDGSGTYKIKGNPNPSKACGFHGFPVLSETSAYQIFAEGKRFDAIGNLSLQDKYGLGEKANEYIIGKYGVMEEGYIDCLSGCIIPVKFIGGNLDQNMIIKNLFIDYDIIGFSGAKEINFYDLSETPAVINADVQKLYLDEGNFSVPDDFGDYTFELSLDDNEILSEEVVVQEVPVLEKLTPRATASAYPTEFEVTVDSYGNITKYQWDFGNNDIRDTTTNKITYTYDSTGTYWLKITVTDSLQRSAYKLFEINVGTPKEIINTFMKKMQEDLENIKIQINDFSPFVQDNLKSILDFNELDEKLTAIYQANASAVNESDYNKIMPDLLELKEKIPESIAISASANLISFYPDEDNINLDILKTISEGEYDIDDKEKYTNSIFAWNQENMETKITFNELSSQYEYSEEPILKTFELKITKKNETSNPYLIIKDIENLKFKEDYSEKSESEYVYIKLTDSQTTIMFSTTEDINFADLPIFISPEINELSLEESLEDIEAKEKLVRLALFILIIFLLTIIGFVSYIVLQEWYKRKYEDYLFKNRNNLYNLISYVQSSKKRGLKDREIIIKLKKAGWKTEQITYVIKKYSGKRTGMFEIPIGNILKIFPKQKVKNIPPKKSIGNFQRTKTFPKNPNLKRTPKKRFFKI